ncbi:MAG: membrane protein [Dehalococcoidia bacterium]|nr:MAG: membrane protein [Dehalococcoidia bacterium]
MQASDLMKRNVVTIRPDISLATAARILLRAGVNAAPVVNEAGRLVGMIGLKDILRAPARSDLGVWATRYTSLTTRARAIARTPVGHVMARRFVTVSPETPAAEVSALLINRERHPLPVVVEGQVVGVIGRADVVAAVLALVDETTEELRGSDDETAAGESAQPA